MNSNIEKILSISASVLLIAIAFTAFFTSYNRHLDYINSSVGIFDEDIMVEISEKEQECHITGSEVIHRLIEVKANKEITKLQNLYAVGVTVPFGNSPEMFIDGKNAEFVEFTDIDPAKYYLVHYDTNSRGDIIGINYTIASG